MNVTITGASGFIGRNLTKYLTDKGMKILPLSLRNNAWKIGLNRQSNAIIHLAGKEYDTSDTSSAEEYFKVNRDLTIELFHEFLQSNITDFIFFSSVKAVADSVPDILTENAAAHPKTPYGKSKQEAEAFLLSQPLPEGKRLFIIRPCMVHGLGDRGNLNLLYKVVKKRIPWILASFENRRSFISIDNLGFFVSSLLLDKKIAGGIYNVADDESLSTNELVSTISEVLGKKPKLWFVNKGLIRKTASIGDVLRLPLNSERLRKLTDNYIVSNQKIKSALGIKKLPLSAKEGIKITIQSFMKD